MRVLAHRGASGYAPENTMAAFNLAVEMKADGIETDVQVSKDGVLVLIHDSTVDRTTDGSGAVADLTWADLSRLDAGGWLDERFAGARIVRLDDFLDWRFGCHGQADGLTICIEVKAPAAARPLVAMLGTRGLANDPAVEVTSFHWDSALLVREALPGLITGFLTPRFDSAEIKRVVRAGLPQICPRADLLTAPLVDDAHQRGLQVRAWGVGTREHLAQVVASGADGTTLNWPDWTA